MSLATAELTQTPDELNDVRRALEYGNTAFGDALSDAYSEAWDTATQPDLAVLRRPVSPADVAYLAASAVGNSRREITEALRSGRVLRRLAILGLMELNVTARLEFADRDQQDPAAPTLRQQYETSVRQIMELCGIQDAELTARVELIKTKRWLLPYPFN